MMMVPQTPLVAIAQRAAVTEEEMAELVPTWVTNLVEAAGGAPFISVAAFVAGGFSQFSKDKTYRNVGRYCDRIEGLVKKRGTAMLTTDEQAPRPGEIAGRRDGHALLISVRWYIRDVLGYVPRLPGLQP